MKQRSTGSHVLRIVVAEVIFLGLIVGLFLANIAQGYTGSCGGFVPFLSQPYPCSFFTYIQQMVFLSLALVVSEAPWALLLLCLPALMYVGAAVVVSLWRRNSQQAEPEEHKA